MTRHNLATCNMLALNVRALRDISLMQMLPLARCSRCAGLLTDEQNRRVATHAAMVAATDARR